MDPENWLRVRALFEKALAVSVAGRAEFIRVEAGDDPTVVAEVQRLLRLHESGSRFLEGTHVFGGPDDDEAPLPPGSRLGPYRLQDVLGAGGMGVIYRAVRVDEFTKQVAIKVIRRGLDTDDVLARFRQERELLAQLEHPNIARLLDGGSTEDRRPYFVMELVDGDRIDRHCDGLGLSVEARIDLFLQVCDAVEYAHRHLVVHRDLKPGNVVVTRDGTPKLLDFGIAKVLVPDVARRDAEEVTATGRRRFTPHYASPEQLRGERATTATDVYLLGLLLFELLTGRRAQSTSSDSPAEIERTICDRPAPRMSERVATSGATAATVSLESDPTPPETPEELARRRGSDVRKLQRRLLGDLDTIVAKALRKEPERRYESARELAEDLRRHRAGLPVRARPDTPVYRIAKFVRRHRAVVALTSATAIVVVAALLTAIKQRIDRASSDQIALAKTAEADRQANELWYGRLRSELPAMMASGSVYSRSATRLDYPRWCEGYLAKFNELGWSIDTAAAADPFRDRFHALEQVRPDIALVVLHSVEDLCGQLFHSFLPYIEIEREHGTIPYDRRFKPADWRRELATARRDFDEHPALHRLWPRLHALVEALDSDPSRRRVWSAWIHWWSTKEDSSDEVLAFEKQLHGDDLLWAADLVRLNRGSVVAKPLLERAVSEDASSFWAQFQLGRAYRKLAEKDGPSEDGNLTLAILHAQAAVAIAPTSSWAFTNLGEYSVELATHWALRRDASSGDVAARAEREHFRWREISIAADEHAIANDPSAPAPSCNLANVVGLPDPDRAERLYKELLAHSPDYKESFDGYANLLRKHLRGEDEVAVREKWLQRHRDDPAAWLELAEALRNGVLSSRYEAWLDALEASADLIDNASDRDAALAGCAAQLEAERRALESQPDHDDAMVRAHVSRLRERLTLYR